MMEEVFYNLINGCTSHTSSGSVRILRTKDNDAARRWIEEMRKYSKYHEAKKGVTNENEKINTATSYLKNQARILWVLKRLSTNVLR